MTKRQDDYIQDLGMLVLDHRLKRLMLRLLEGAEQLYDALDFGFKPRWVSTYKSLATDAPMTVTELGRRLRLTHPAVIQITRDMAKGGWIVEERDPEDGRRRLLSLSPHALSRRQELEQAWQALATAQQAIFDELGVDILGLLERVDGALDRQSLCERALEGLGRETRASTSTLSDQKEDP